MTDFLSFFIDELNDIVSLLDSTIVLPPLVSLWDLMLSALVICFVVSAFWRGARA